MPGGMDFSSMMSQMGGLGGANQAQQDEDSDEEEKECSNKDGFNDHDHKSEEK